MLSFREISSTGAPSSDAKPPSVHPRAYQRLIGYECRSDTAAGSSRSSIFSKSNNNSTNNASELPNRYPADLLFAMSDGEYETRIFSVSHTFHGHPRSFSPAIGSGSQHHLVDPGAVLPKRELAALKGYRDIVHASCSHPGPYGEIVMCFTERSMSMTGVGSANALYEYRLFLHIVGEKDDYDDGITLQERPNNNNISTKHYLQVGYFIRSDPKKSSFYLLRACDHAQSGLQFREVVCKRKVEKGITHWSYEVRGESETAWSLVTFPVWHQWDPFLQRIYFWGVLQNHAFLVYRVDGHPERRSFEFEHKTHRMKFQLQQSYPLSAVWAPTGVSSTARNHMVVVPIHYECDTVDYALCQQLLPSGINSNNTTGPPANPNSPSNNPNNNSSSPGGGGLAAAGGGAATGASPQAQGPLRVVVSIMLLRNYMDTVEKLEIDLGRPLMQPGDQDPSDAFGRIAFLFVRGMLVLYLPGYFVHYVDVSHPDAPPRYLFGGPIDGIPRRQVSSGGPTMQPSPSIPVNAGGGGGAGQSASEMPTPYGSPGGRGTSLRPPEGSATRSTGDIEFARRGTGDSSGRVYSNPTLTQRHGSDAMPMGTAAGDSSTSPAGATISPLFTSVVGRLPVPSGNWVYVPGTTTVAQVDLPLRSLWNYIGDVLEFLNRPSSSDHEMASLRSAIHVATAHYPYVSDLPPTSPPSRGDEPDLAVEDYLKELLLDPNQRRSIRFPVLVQLMLGVAYNATRHHCRKEGNPYFRCLSYEDERLKEEMRDVPAPLRKVLHNQAHALRLWDQTASPSMRTSERASPIHPPHLAEPCCYPCNPTLRVRSPVVQFIGLREKEKHVRDTHDNTDRDWWIPRFIKVQHSTLLGKIRSITKAGTVSIERVPTIMQRSFHFSNGDGLGSPFVTMTSSSSLGALERANSGSGMFTAAGRGNHPSGHYNTFNNNNGGLTPHTPGSPSVAYANTLTTRLADRQIPSEVAQQTAHRFHDHLKHFIRQLMSVGRIVALAPPEPLHGDLFFLEQLGLALQHVGLPPDAELLGRQAALATHMLPSVVLLQTQKCGLSAIRCQNLMEENTTHPLDLISEYEHATRVRYGQALTEAERQDAESRRMVPLSLQSHGKATVQRSSRRSPLLALDEWQSMVAANCVSWSIDHRATRESFLLNFEAGPLMQRSAASYIPTNTFTNPVKFAPFGTWFSTVDHGVSTTAGTATVRRERAKEVLGHALKPFI